MMLRFTPKIPLIVLILTLTGCISHDVERRDDLVGEVFRKGLLCGVPRDIEDMAHIRRAAYRRMNDIDYGKMHGDPCMDEKQMNEILAIRWELARLHRHGEFLVEELKELRAYDPCEEQVEGVETEDAEERAKTIKETEDELRMLHQEYMEKHHWLMRMAGDRRPGFFGRIFYLG